MSESFNKDMNKIARRIKERKIRNAYSSKKTPKTARKENI